MICELNDEEVGILDELQKWLDKNVKKEFQLSTIRLMEKRLKGFEQ